VGAGAGSALHQRLAVGADARHGEAAMLLVPLLLRRIGTQPRATLPGLHQGEQSPAADQRPIGTLVRLIAPSSTSYAPLPLIRQPTPRHLARTVDD
jgi:hypothetical protein